MSAARWIRYLATTDDSAIGIMALFYLKAMLGMGRVRVCTLSGGMVGAWEPYSALLATPMGVEASFVNVVCCPSDQWEWVQRVPMPKRMADGRLITTNDVAVGHQELYTAGVHNVLLTGEHGGSLTRKKTCAGLCYEQIVNPSRDAHHTWSRARHMAGGAPAVLVPIPVPDLDRDAFRAVILP